MKSIYILILVLFNHYAWCQLVENAAPFNIKTIAFKQSNHVVFPFFELGDEFEFSFDDLYGNEEDYYFSLTHCNYDWNTSDLTRNEYLTGNDNQRIQDYQNSFNTLQGYSHYRLNFPNNFCQITKSGNYILSILNKNKEIIFSRKFIIYEKRVEVPIQIKRSRTLNDIAEKHNVEFAIKSKNILFQNPLQNIKIALFQNGRWNTAKYNIKPQYTIGNDLIYRYNTETQFWAGNEYYYYDNKDIKTPTNNIARVDSNSGLYKTLLYSNEVRKGKGYTFFPDINGIFQNRNIFARDNNDVETDYTWVYFSLFAPNYLKDVTIYVTGLFNNYQMTDENKMDYNVSKGIYEKAIMIKQGFINYNYTLVNTKNQIDHQNAIDGNYYQTENKYQAFVYYRANGERFDRIIGVGEASSQNITN
ncbi:DUF5103 domain-containing protein [Flavobacterium covae]|uniref:type IX secretion system plug protein n=1 Tax=Flavobacterium covae TaxID=2906076 RepID=UPI001FB7CD94|nr:DUF5103 domain-containing protein [Flavobacterium covae]MCJ1806205.1 DUF5103 domain-containing protein [Flavobacterium covae]